ncbi:MAG: hypothetical protein J7K90_07360 [Desulfuromusa sp.]|nr:hypothetical protein [Desulfuromusa sp.]
MTKWNSSFFLVVFWLMITATVSFAIYDGAGLGYIDNVTVNGQEMETFDEHQIVFYPEDLIDGIVEIRGLLESEQRTTPVAKLQVQISLDGGRNWQPASGHSRWSFRFHPRLEEIYNISLRVVKETFKTPQFVPLSPIPMELQPVFTSLKPNRWLPGKSYAITVTGLLLDKVESVSLGAGIQVENLEYDGKVTLHFTVSIDKNLSPSVRFATVMQQGRMEKTAARGWILKQPPKLGKLPPLVWKPENNFELRQGRVFLRTPEWTFSGDMVNNHHPVPVLNDATVLSWKEETPGLADIFEVRFFTPGGKLIDSKTINLRNPTLYTTAFKPGSQFVARLFGLIAKGKQQIKSIQGEPVIAAADAAGQLSFSLQPPGFSATYKPNAASNGKLLSPVETYVRNNKGSVNLLWQVVGLKRITMTKKQRGVTESNSQQKGKQQIKTEETKLVEIELSERWPLHLPNYSPTGMICDEKNQFELDLVNWSHPGHKNPEDLIHYPGDTLTIGGEVSLNSSPWAVSAQTTYSGGETISDESYQFNNVIVDWGDGQWTQLNAKAVDSSLPGWSNADTLNFQESHIYSYPGGFKVHLYVVPQDQMGQLAAIVAAHSNLSEVTSSSAPKGLTLQPASTQISEDPGSRIFMLYCNPMDVTIIQDTAATGPLTLAAIDITSFSSDATQEAVLPGQKLEKQGVLQQIGKAGKKTLSVNAQNLSMAANPAQIISMGEDTRVSSCDGGLWAKGILAYFGQGYARIQWLVDGVVIDSKEIKIGPSQIRKDLTSSDPETWGEPLRSELRLDSPRLPISDIALHHVRLSAVVVPDPTWSMVNSVALQSALVGHNKQSSSNKKGRAPGALTLNAHADKGLKPIFSPIVPGGSDEKTAFKQSGSLMATLKEGVSTQYLKPGVTLFQPPYSVISPEKRYLVEKNTSDTLCQMNFPTQEGLFEIAGLKKLHGQNGIFSGTGLLIYKLADGGPGSSSEHYIPLSFKQWQVSIEDAIVKQGELRVSVDETLDSLPGMKAILRKMTGTAGEHLSATLDVTVGDPTLRVVGKEEPQTWKNISSVLSAEGDWYASGYKLDRSLIGWSMTSIESANVRLDLSHKEGETPSCGYGGASWVGVHLGTVTLHPYTFDLADVSIQSTNWSIAAEGLCGKAETGHFSHAFGQGQIGWEKMTINAFQGNVYSNYINFYVDMDWPKIHLKSAKTTFNYSPGSSVDVQLGFDKPPTVTEKYDFIDMKILSKSFSHTENGWGLMADAELTFRDRRGKLFADKVTINDLLFSINNYVVYNGGSIPLDIKGQVDGADELISALTLTTGEITNPRKMTLDFTTEFSLEGMGKSKDPVHVIYGISKKNHQLAVSVNPLFPGEIILESEFPDTNSATSNKVSINYGQGVSGSTGSSAGNCGHDTFAGHINTKMFGSLAFVTGTFRFGTINGNRFWLGFLKGDNLHIPIYTEVYLEMVQGGLAYNFDHDAFNHDGGYTACPSPGKGLLFSAGLGLKIGEDDVIRADGILTIQPADSFYQIDAHALLFNVADLSGRLRYWNSAFDGEIWGNVSLLSGQISINAPEHSCGIHLDPNTWKYFMGTRDNPVTGQVTNLLNGEAYLTLGNEVGLLVGAKATYQYEKTFHDFGYSGGVDMSGELSLLLNPLRFDGRIDALVYGKFINPIKDIGLSVDSHAWVGCCSPVKFGFGFSVSCCCVSGGADIYVLPSPDIDGHVGCSCCPW